MLHDILKWNICAKKASFLGQQSNDSEDNMSFWLFIIPFLPLIWEETVEGR